MAFHITQCPCCNSTFSISAQLLHAGNGKVRCGACLSVFLAEQQLVDSESATDGSETNDSVFVGHAPEDYFDPASFLTREALQQQSISGRVATAESEVTGRLKLNTAQIPRRRCRSLRSVESLLESAGQRRASQPKQAPREAGRGQSTPRQRRRNRRTANDRGAMSRISCRPAARRHSKPCGAASAGVTGAQSVPTPINPGPISNPPGIQEPLSPNPINSLSASIGKPFSLPLHSAMQR